MKVLGTGTAYVSVASLFLVISNYAIHLAIARQLGVAAYGAFGILMSLYLITTAVLTSGIPRALSQAISHQKKEGSSLFSSLFTTALILQMGFSLILAAAYFLARQPLASLLNDRSLLPYLGILGILMIPTAGVILFQNGYWNGLRQFGRQAKIIVIHSIFRVLAVILVLWGGWQIAGVLWGLAAAATITFIWAAMPIINFFRKIRLNFSSSLVHSLLRFALPLMGAALLFNALKNLPVLFIKTYLADNVLAGWYTAAATLANIPYLLFVSLPLTIMPSISEALSNNNHSLTKKYIQQSLRYLLLIVAPLVTLGSIAAKDLLHLFYTAEFFPATATLQLLFFSSAAFLFFLTLAAIITAQGNSRIEMLLNLLLLPLMILFNHLFIPRWGMEGAAAAAALTGIVGMVAAAIIVYRKFNVLLPFSTFIRCLACTALLFLVARQLSFSGLFLFLNGALLLLFYLLLLYVSRELQPDDIHLVKRIVKRIV